MRHHGWGVNLDFDNVPFGRPDPADLELFSWVRLVAHKSAGFADYVQALAAAGVKSIVVLARESFPQGTIQDLMDGGHVVGVTIDMQQVVATVTEYANTVQPAVWELGNEPDDTGTGPSSFRLRPAQYRDFAIACAEAIKSVQPNVTLITAGLDSGMPEWLRDAWPLPVDGIALHPYGQRPSPDWPTSDWGFSPPGGDVGNLLNRYADMFGRPLWITEFGSNDTMGLPNGGTVHDEYYARMFKTLDQRADVPAAVAFCWSNGMVDGYGLLDNNNPPGPTPAFNNLPQD